MAESLLNVPDALRFWSAAGWRYFFQERIDPPLQSVADDPAKWPRPWCDYAARLTPGARLLITYGDLAADMTGQGDASRRAFWRTCITALHCAKGTVGFFPMSEECGQGYVANPDMFFRAMAVYRPSLVACFGEGAFAALAGTAGGTESEIQINHVTCLGLPSPEEIMAEGDGALREIVHMLRFHLTRP